MLIFLLCVWENRVRGEKKQNCCVIWIYCSFDSDVECIASAVLQQHIHMHSICVCAAHIISPVSSISNGVFSKGGTIQILRSKNCSTIAHSLICNSIITKLGLLTLRLTYSFRWTILTSFNLFIDHMILIFHFSVSIQIALLQNVNPNWTALVKPQVSFIVHNTVTGNQVGISFQGRKCAHDLLIAHTSLCLVMSVITKRIVFNLICPTSNGIPAKSGKQWF